MIDDAPRGFSAPDIPPGDVFDRCVRCGLCLPSCPTYVETLVETSGPRGRIALIKAVAEERLDLTSPGFVHQMSECLDCRACEAVCPSGVAYGSILEPARAQVERAVAPGRAPFARLLRAVAIGRLFSDMRAMRAAARLLRFYQRSGLRDLVRRSGLLRALGLQDVEALAPRIDDRFFTPDDATYEPRGRASLTVLLHAGCIMHVAFADWHRASVRVLTAAGMRVVVPRDQGCCGAITVHAGDLERGRALARRTIEAFERSGADVLVINAAGCGSTLKEYGGLFRDDPAWHARAERFSEHVRDINELLDGAEFDRPLRPLAALATYQEPCHLAHAQRITAAPRRLLARIPALVLREMDESSLCCGSAGIYNVTQPEMAQRLQERKLARIAEVDPQIVVTANPGCALQLRNGLEREGKNDVRVAHVVELLDESLSA